MKTTAALTTAALLAFAGIASAGCIEAGHATTAAADMTPIPTAEADVANPAPGTILLPLTQTETEEG